MNSLVQKRDNSLSRSPPVSFQLGPSQWRPIQKKILILRLPLTLCQVSFALGNIIFGSNLSLPLFSGLEKEVKTPAAGSSTSRTDENKPNEGGDDNEARVQE